MKRLLIALLLLLPLLLSAQVAEEVFGGRFTTTASTSLGGTSIQVSGVFKHSRNTWKADSIQVGDWLIDCDCNSFVVASITSTLDNSIIMTVTAQNAGVTKVKACTGGIIRPFDDYIRFPNDLPTPIIDCILNYNYNVIPAPFEDIYTSGDTLYFINSEGDTTWVVNDTGINDLPDVDTTGIDIGDILQWNGTTWVVVNAPTYISSDSTAIQLVYAPAHGLTDSIAYYGYIPVKSDFTRANSTSVDSAFIAYAIDAPHVDSLLLMFSGFLNYVVWHGKELNVQYYLQDDSTEDTTPGTVSIPTAIASDSLTLLLREVGSDIAGRLRRVAVPSPMITAFGGDPRVPTDSVMQAAIVGVYLPAGIAQPGTIFTLSYAGQSDNPTYQQTSPNTNPLTPSHAWLWDGAYATRITTIATSVDLQDTLFGGLSITPLIPIDDIAVGLPPSDEEVAMWLDTNYTVSGIRLTNGTNLYYIGSGTRQNPDYMWQVNDDVSWSGADTQWEKILKRIEEPDADTSGYNTALYVTGDSLYIVDDNDTLLVDLSGIGDNLGNHLATQDLDMAWNEIQRVDTLKIQTAGGVDWKLWKEGSGDYLYFSIGPSNTVALRLGDDQTVRISDAYSLPTTTGDSLQILRSLGNGTAIWSDEAASDTSGFNRSFYIIGDTVYIVDDLDTLSISLTNLLDSIALDDLLDVNVPAPSAGQALIWDGNEWISMQLSYAVGPADELYLDATISFADNQTLSPVPSVYPEEVDAVSVTSATSPVFLERFVSGPVNRTTIPAGTWVFNTYGSTTSNTGTNSITTRINRRVLQTGMTGTFTGAGATRTFTVTGGTPFVPGDAGTILTATLIETPTQTAWITAFTSSSVVTVTLTDPAFVNVAGVTLNALYYLVFSANTGDMTGSAAALYATPSAQGEFTGWNETDRIVAAYFALTDAGAARTISLYHGGSTHYSHIETPLNILHNDLAGLNEGDYMHLDSVEYTQYATLLDSFSILEDSIIVVYREDVEIHRDTVGLPASGVDFAANGNIMSGDSVIWGGDLDRITEVGGNFKLTFSGTVNSVPKFTVTNNSATGSGLLSTGGLTGVTATASQASGIGLKANAFANPIYATNTTITNGIVNGIVLQRSSLTTPLIDDGISIVFQGKDKSGNFPFYAYIDGFLQDTTTTSTDGAISIRLMENDVLSRKALLSSTGQLTLDGYAANALNNPDSVLYVTGVDATGDLHTISVDSLGGGAADGNGIFDAANEGDTSQVTTIYLDDEDFGFYGMNYGGSFVFDEGNVTLSSESVKIEPLGGGNYTFSDSSFQLDASTVFNINGGYTVSSISYKNNSKFIQFEDAGLYLQGDNEIILSADTLNATAVTTFLGLPYALDSLSYYGDTLRIYQDGNSTYPFKAEITAGSADTDNQTIDTITYSRDSLSLSLETDGEPAQVVRTPGNGFLRDSITGAALTIDLKKYNNAVVEIRMESCTATTLTVNNPWSALTDATYPTFEGQTGVYTFHFMSGSAMNDQITWPAAFLDMSGTALGTDTLIAGTAYTCYYNPVSAKYYCK